MQINDIQKYLELPYLHRNRDSNEFPDLTFIDTQYQS